MNLISTTAVALVFGSSLGLLHTQPQKPSKIRLACTYRLAFKLDSSNSYVAYENMRLLVSDSASEFVSYNKIKRDSVLNHVMESAKNTSPEDAAGFGLLAAAVQAPKTKFPSRIYKTYLPAACDVYDDIDSQHFVYGELLFPCQWVIGTATSTVAGYSCQKATTHFGGRQWEAWFTRQIPVSDGPYKFSGLPGLIVKINDTRHNYDFELLSIKQPYENQLFKLPPYQAKRIEKAAFIAAAKAARLTALTRLEQRGIMVDNAEEVNRQFQQRLKRENNPIELK